MIFEERIVVSLHDEARESEKKNVKIVSLIISKLNQPIKYQQLDAFEKLELMISKCIHRQ